MAISPSSRPLIAETIIKAELLKIVIHNSAINWSAGLFGALLFTIVFPMIDPSSRSHAVAWAWCAVVVLVALPGIWMARQATRGELTTERLFKYGRQLVAYGTCTAAVWGATAWLLLPADSGSEVFLTTMMAMVIVGGTSNQAAHWSLTRAFTLSFAVVFCSGLARIGDRHHLALALAFALYALAAALLAKTHGASVRRQVISKLENQSLRAIAEKERSIAEAERERADSASQAKTAFLAAASHDLRQPLHALVQYSAHLNRASRDPELDDTVRRIGASIDAMRDLLDSILDLSKLMVGGVQPMVAGFPIERLFERLDVQLRPLATAKGLQFITTRSEAIVMSDDVLLERILRNLILNAIRYTDQGHVTLRCRQRHETLQIQVRDTGIGIPQGDLRRIFDPFYQVGNHARDRRKGLGLGLAIVRQLCDLLGYRIKVRTEVGRGTAFLFSVPLCTDPSMVATLRPTVGRSERDFVRGAFVILIDDDALSREASEHTLKSFGCRVIAAASGVQAIERLQNQEFAPQLILADYRLEEETGIEAIKAVTENLQVLFGETFSIPALVLSGDTAPDELRRVNDHGYPMLHKPVAEEDLWSGLNRLLERKAQETEF